jgi:hypothetical protein
MQRNAKSGRAATSLKRCKALAISCREINRAAIGMRASLRPKESERQSRCEEISLSAPRNPPRSIQPTVARQP